MDFGAANSLVAGALDKLQQLRDDPCRVTEQLKRFPNAKWDIEKQRTCRNQNEIARDLTPEILWRNNTFLPVLDQIMSSVRERFEQNKEIFDAISYFSPKKFPAIVDSIDNSEELGTKISAFCENYNFDVGDCAAELISFAAMFGKFEKSDEHAQDNVFLYDGNDEVRENNEEEDEDQGKQSVGDGEKLKEIRSKLSYHRALEILANPSYHLVDAYPLLYNAYGKILAIPMTSCTPERTFSVVKQVKTRLRSTMEQDRLESLILMATEREIASHLDIDKIIDIFGASSPELSRLLIK